MNLKKSCCICFTSEKVHKFPQGKGSDTAERFAVWANFAALENVLEKQKCYLLCEKHFEKRMFMNYLSARLVKPAFPTLHPPVYQGPTTIDGSPVSPSVPKSETFQMIFTWKESVLLSSSAPPDSSSRCLPTLISGKANPSFKKILNNNEEFLIQSSDFTGDILKNNPITKIYALANNTDELTKNPTISTAALPPSSSSLIETETIKILPVKKTYTRKRVLVKRETITIKVKSEPGTAEVQEILDSEIGSSNVIVSEAEASSLIPDSPLLRSDGKSLDKIASSVFVSVAGMTSTLPQHSQPQQSSDTTNTTASNLAGIRFKNLTDSFVITNTGLTDCNSDSNISQTNCIPNSNTSEIDEITSLPNSILNVCDSLKDCAGICEMDRTTDINISPTDCIVDAYTNLPSNNKISYESSFMEELIPGNHKRESDLLSEAISNANISFTQGTEFLCSGSKKKKKWGPLPIDTLFDDMKYIENLIIYYY